MLESESNALPLGDTPMIVDKIWGDLRGSNPWPPEPQSGVLPTELRSP